MEKPVWEQIDEDNEDYQYFKEQDQKKLQQTLEAVQKDCPLEKDDEV